MMNQGFNNFEQETYSRVDVFLMKNADCFPQEQLPELREYLSKLEPAKQQMLLGILFRNPFFIFIMSLFFGTLGIDRFLLGHFWRGLIKLLTAGLGGLWTIYDWFVIKKETRQENLRVLYALTDRK